MVIWFVRLIGVAGMTDAAVAITPAIMELLAELGEEKEPALNSAEEVAPEVALVVKDITAGDRRRRAS